MAKRKSLFRQIRTVNKNINKLADLEKKDQSAKSKAQDKNNIGLTKKELKHNRFKHQDADKLTAWVNDNNIELVTIAHNGNYYVAFYWETELND